MSKKIKKIAITTGDVNGIGAEITIKALNALNLDADEVLLISNKTVIKFYEKLMADEGMLAENYVSVCDKYEFVDVAIEEKDIIPGALTKESGEFSFQSLLKACALARQGLVSAIVTAPVSKEALYLAGHKFNGQTEVLQEFLAHDNQHSEMLFVAKDFRVLLLTRHVALKEISLTVETVVNKVFDLAHFFKEKFKIDNPKFALCSFNPHAGEGGILGSEEIEVLHPAVEILRSKNIQVTNPMPADTLFIQGAQAYLKGAKVPYDCYIACYHDQGLIPIKSVASEETVNMTIGLDVVRTSPCHGTAFDIAGKSVADEKSMIEAIQQAIKY